ncbi:MAG: DNA topoisomerase 3 [Chthoniobacterales bacterium]
MPKSLVIAEKPSVAADIAKALRVPKQGDHFENDDYAITSAVGHLVELEMPEDIDKKKYGFWRLETLPIIPEKFGLKPIKDSKSRLDQIKKLLARKDVERVINACDAGREGELIFDNIYRVTKSKLPVKRAWMQTMTSGGIREAFEKLRDGSEMQGLASAARSRSESDWLIGINGTRAITKRMFGSKGRNVATVGRVQTPTLALVYTREEEIRNFKAREYWRVTAQFEIANGTYEGAFQKPNFRKADEHDRADRIWEKELADSIVAACQNQPLAAVSEEKKSSSQASPRLYDLTTLQREANNRFGLSARRTLQIAQALYERHKVITYPRTDSRALPEDYIDTCREALANLQGDLAKHAHSVLEQGWVRPNKRIFNNAQISDHFAIIPTTTEPSHLDEMESRVYDMIARRFVAAFFPPAEYDVTTRISKVVQHQFKTEGKVLTSAGWLAVYGRTTIDDDAKALPALTVADNSRAKTLSVELQAEATKPPPRYTEATLLTAMESAGKLVEDEDLAEAMKERGLGTPATRAEIIDGLIYQKYLERNQRELVPTPKAESLLQFLAAVEADALTKPDMTGEWEYKLRQMEHGKFKRDEFMSEIVDVTKRIVDRTKNFEEHHADSRETDIVSPTDGKPLVETLRGFKSQDGKLMIYKVMSGRKISEDEVRELVTNGEVGPLDDFVSKAGTRFPAKIRLVDNEKKPDSKKAELDFGNKVDVDALTPFWSDPKTGAELCEAATQYILRERDGDAWKEAFKVGRLMCKKPVTREQAIQLVELGKTGLIEGFTSKKGRPFDAFLVRHGNRITWEFPPRKPRESKNGDGARAPRKPKQPVDLAKATKLSESKLGDLYQTEDKFVVAQSQPSGTPRVVFELKRNLCGREIPAEEAERLVQVGRTGLIEGFVSKRGSNFSAYLKLAKDKKKAEFEFPPR